MAIADMRLFTAEEFFHFPDEDGHLELIAGEVVRMSPAGGVQGELVLILGSELLRWARLHQLGRVYGAETGFVLRSHPDTVRAPDAAFVVRDRLPPEGSPDGFLPLAPDLAVEVVSPHDSLTEVEGKVFEYLDAGTRMVWVVNPRSERVTVYRSASQIRSLKRGEVLSGEDVLPGFELALDELFRR